MDQRSAYWENTFRKQRNIALSNPSLFSLKSPFGSFGGVAVSSSHRLLCHTVLQLGPTPLDSGISASYTRAKFGYKVLDANEHSVFSGVRGPQKTLARRAVRLQRRLFAQHS